MRLDIGQPVPVADRGIVTVLAATHGALVFGRHVDLRALAPRDIVIGSLQVLVDVEGARLIAQVRRTSALDHIDVRRIVQRVVAVRALQLALGVDIPGPAQFAFAGQIDARGIDPLRCDHLTGCRGLRKVQITGIELQGLGDGRMHCAMAGGAIGVARVLNLQDLAVDETLCGEGRPVPCPAFRAGLDDVQSEEGGRVGVGKTASANRSRARGQVGSLQMAEETVHFHGPGCEPIPYSSIPGCVQERRLRIIDARFQGGQWFSGTRGRGRTATGHAITVEHQPFGGRQIETLVAGLRQKAISQRIPLAEQAGAGVPCLVG